MEIPWQHGDIILARTLIRFMPVWAHKIPGNTAQGGFCENTLIITRKDSFENY